jgi:D-psicose/D-tagatose/L-ribulose 3-epimerase
MAGHKGCSVTGRSDAQRRSSVESLHELCHYAGKQGITIGPEPLNRYEHFFVNTASEAVALIREVGAPNLKVHASENDRSTPGSGHTD